MSRPAAHSPALLLLGRLDGRLQHSPAADIWLARARLDGAAALAGLAGVPIARADITDWICGRTPPPRRSEGLNDPLSVAALFHFALTAQATTRDPVTLSTLNLLRTLLDDRAEAETWGASDLVHFGPAFREAGALLSAPYPAASFLAIAERLLEVRQNLDVAARGGRTVTTIDGRQLHVDPRSFDTVWLLGCHLPQAFTAAGLTLRPLPSLVGLPKFLPHTAGQLADDLEVAVGKAVRIGLADLDRLEARLNRLPSELAVTRRSKVPLLLRLELAYPGLRTPAIARTLGISHQGASKLAEKVRILVSHGRA